MTKEQNRQGKIEKMADFAIKKQISYFKNYKNIFFLTIITVLEIIFFRNVMGNGKLFGDSGDGRLTMLFAEHWFRFFTGKEAFPDLMMFFPTNGTLGFSDMMLGFGIIHSLFRFIGIDMYLSYKFTIMILHVFGSVSFFYMLYKKLSINLFWSFFALFSFSYSTVFAQAGFDHSQLSAINFLPLFTYFFISLIQNGISRKKRNLYFSLVILTYELICYTAWYIAFFTALFCLIFLLSYIIQMIKEKKSVLSAIKLIFCTFKFDLIFLVALAIVLMIPFIKVYLPIFMQSTGYDYNGIKIYMPELIDLINVTSRNLLFGKAVSIMQLQDGEVAEGFSLIVLALFIFVRYLSKKQKNENIVSNALFIAIVISLLVCIKLNGSGLSLWYLVYHFIPGGSSIRAIGRFLFYLSYPLSFYIAFCGNKIKSPNFIHSCNKRIVISLCLSLTLFFVSQMSKNGVSTHWHRQDQKKYLAKIPTPPTDAESFYLIPNINDNRIEPYLQLDAYEIATTFNIPTLNGYSGQEPKEWHGIWQIKSGEYRQSINRWILRLNLQNVYAYDANTNSWIKHSDTVPK